MERSGAADRVIGLGPWVARVVPWIALPPTYWLDDGGDAGASTPPAPKGITVGDRQIPLTASACGELGARLRAAIEAREPFVPYRHDGEDLRIPPFPTS